MTPLSYHSSDLSSIALEAMRLLVQTVCARPITKFKSIWYVQG